MGYGETSTLRQLAQDEPALEHFEDLIPHRTIAGVAFGQVAELGDRRVVTIVDQRRDRIRAAHAGFTFVRGEDLCCCWPWGMVLSDRTHETILDRAKWGKVQG